MPNKITQEEFIERANKVHNFKYDYSKLEYKDSHSKIKIICHEKDENGNEHGEFEQQADSHLRGCGCRKCGRVKNHKNITFTTGQFIEKARKVHGDKYDYSKVNYVNNHTLVKIICPIHDEFEQIPASHIKGCGCLKCRNEYVGRKLSSNTEKFIEKARKIHKDKYDYSKVTYINSHTPVTIICHNIGYDGKEHGEFEQTPDKHLNGKGCKRCKFDKLTYTQEEFIKKAKEVHGDKYDYSKIKYEKANKKVCIVCNKTNSDGKKHGEFWQTPTAHLRGQGCNKCGKVNEIKLYNTIKEHFTDAIHIYYDKFLGKQSIDIYIPCINIGIEYQGDEHFRPIEFFGGEDELLKIKERDKRKFEKCKEHGLKLLYFTYNKQWANLDYFDNIYTDEKQLLNMLSLSR